MNAMMTTNQSDMANSKLSRGVGQRKGTWRGKRARGISILIDTMRHMKKKTYDNDGSAGLPTNQKSPARRFPKLAWEGRHGLTAGWQAPPASSKQ